MGHELEAVKCANMVYGCGLRPLIFVELTFLFLKRCKTQKITFILLSVYSFYSFLSSSADPPILSLNEFERFIVKSYFLLRYRCNRTESLALCQMTVLSYCLN